MSMPAPASGTTPGVHLDLRRSFFPVVGSTARQIRTTFGVLGPVRGGQRFGAFTDWELSWRYRHAESAAGLHVCEASVEVLATITAPRWTPARSAASAFVSTWEKYVEAIEVHEQGHVALAVQAACLLRRRLLALARIASKAALDDAASAIADEVLRDARTQERGYDLATRHGAEQGVVLPA